MIKLEILSAITLFMQTIIVFGQLVLSYKISKHDTMNKKGYFIIEKYGKKAAESIQKHFLDMFDLKCNPYIGFYLAGESDVILCGVEYSINGTTQQNSYIPYRTMFTQDDRFKKFSFEHNLTEKHLNNNRVDIVLKLKMKNMSGYKYIEIITMSFEKVENDTLWRLCKYNMDFK